MDISVLNIIFWVCLIVGFALPLLNLILGWIGASADFDLDADLDVDGPFPFNIMCLCLFLVVFGVLGIAAKRWMVSIPVTVGITLACAAAGVSSYWLLYKFVIKKLNQSNPVTISYADLPGREAEVTLRISGGGIGTVSVSDSTGARISFRARIDPELREYIGETIPQGARVVITEALADEKCCYVSTPHLSELKQ